MGPVGDRAIGVLVSAMEDAPSISCAVAGTMSAKRRSAICGPRALTVGKSPATD
jgi:hypothetical protein